MKISLTLLFFTITVLASAQIKDTINISDSIMKIYYSSYTINGNNSVIEGKSVSADAANKFMVLKDSVMDYIKKVAYGSYCRFYNEDSLLIEEGVWYDEIWVGYYKKYHPTGVMMEEGEYSNKVSGTKTGVWKYYSAIGMLEYEEEYKDGELIKYVPRR
jgi:antitoxin component YwqK of YwqJK toxin-antitoxin module